MKKFTKLCLIVSLVCVCIAALCVGAGIAMGSGIKDVQHMADNGELNIGNWRVGDSQFYWSLYEDDSKLQEVKEGSVNASFMEAEVESLSVDVKYGEIYFMDSDSDEIKITVDAPKRNSYECKNDNGTLKLKDKTSSFKWYMGNKNNVTVTIEIPKGKEFEEVKLITNAGTIDIDHVLAAKEMELELDAGELIAQQLKAGEEFFINVGAGSVTVEEFETKELKVDCGVGEATLKGVVKENAEADCGVGEITLTLKGKEEDYDYDISCGVGSVNINGTSYSSLSTDKEINNHAGRKVSLDCGVGEIDVAVEEQSGDMSR